MNLQTIMRLCSFALEASCEIRHWLLQHLLNCSPLAHPLSNRCIDSRCPVSILFGVRQGMFMLLDIS
jgi:hypothetical protein